MTNLLLVMAQFLPFRMTNLLLVMAQFLSFRMTKGLGSFGYASG